KAELRCSAFSLIIFKCLHVVMYQQFHRCHLYLLYLLQYQEYLFASEFWPYIIEKRQRDLCCSPPFVSGSHFVRYVILLLIVIRLPVINSKLPIKRMVYIWVAVFGSFKPFLPLLLPVSPLPKMISSS